MSNLIKGFTIALEADINAEYAEQLKRAIGFLRGVREVTEIESNSDDWINRQQIKWAIYKKLREAILKD